MKTLMKLEALRVIKLKNKHLMIMMKTNDLY